MRYVQGKWRRRAGRIALLGPVVLAAKRHPPEFAVQYRLNGERGVHGAIFGRDEAAQRILKKGRLVTSLSSPGQA